MSSTTPRSDAPPTAMIERPSDITTALAAAGVPTGRPVIVLIGGAAGIDEASAQSLLPIIRDGVIEPARDLEAVVVTGGTDSGVMGVAGRARREVGGNVSLVGVAPRGKVETPLEPNHSLVLLVPGDEWGSELPWLVSTARTVSGGQPVAAVLADGGPIALSEAAECARQGWPVITIEGSGRSADALAAFATGGAALDVDIARSALRVVRLGDGPDALVGAVREALGGEKREPTASAESAADTPAGPPRANDYPALYVAASEAAKRGQTAHRRLSLAEITLTTFGLGIVLTATWLRIAFNLPSGLVTNLIVAVSAVSFIAALVLKFIGRSSGFDSDWYNGRALAETVKGLSWRYMMRVSPYANPDSDRRFTADLAHLLRRGPKFRQATDRLPDRPQQISARMRAVRELPVAERRDYYVQHRLLDQADWYRRRGASSGSKGTRWFWMSVFFQLAAAATAVAALAGIGDTVLRLITLLGSIALAIAAWSQLNRYDELARAYAVAFQELSLIAATADDAADEATLTELVRDGEDAVGREHRLWVAKRTEAVPGPTDVDDGEGGGSSD